MVLWLKNDNFQKNDLKTSTISLTLCGLKTHRFFKTCLKGIVNYPATRSKQLPVRQVLQLRLLLCFLLLWVHQILAVLHSIFYLYLFTQATVKCWDEINQGFLLIKILLRVDGCSYLQFNCIIFSANKFSVGTSSTVWSQVASVPFVLSCELVSPNYLKLLT